MNSIESNEYHKGFNLNPIRPKMRLIKCSTLQLEEFLPGSTPVYTILSHTWGDEEVSFSKFNSPSQMRAKASSHGEKFKEGYKKIQFTCNKALEQGLQHAWIDTCCIDKSSSSELSESINSMFQWYGAAIVCYVYLADVTSDNFKETFPRSRWFRRGWTLQELIAPLLVEFFDSDGNHLGWKADLSKWISDFTGIDERALRRPDDEPVNLGHYSVAQRMSWAADRQTTRPEDIAYSLLGIFDVNMPLLYGEGHKAFIRLQEEILKHSNDQSIFAYDLNTDVDERRETTRRTRISFIEQVETVPLLADDPGAFRNCGHLKRGMEPTAPYSLTNLGLDIELPLIPIFPDEETATEKESTIPEGWFGLLNCRSGVDSQLVGILLRSASANDTEMERVTSPYYQELDTTILVGERAALEAVPTRIRIVRHPESVDFFQLSPRFDFKVLVTISLALRNLGYAISTASSNETSSRWNKAVDTKRTEWNAETEVLSITHTIAVRCYYKFVVESSEDLPSFMVVGMDDNVFVCGKKDFSWEDYFFFNRYSRSDVRRRYGEKIVLRPNNDTELRVVASTTEKRVCHWRMFDIAIDAVGIDRRNQKSRR